MGHKRAVVRQEKSLRVGIRPNLPYGFLKLIEGNVNAGQTNKIAIAPNGNPNTSNQHLVYPVEFVKIRIGQQLNIIGF